MKKFVDVNLREDSPGLSLCAQCTKRSWRKETGESDKYIFLLLRSQCETETRGEIV